MFYVCDGRRHLLRRASMAAPKDGGTRRGRRGGGAAGRRWRREARRRPLGRSGVVSPGGAAAGAGRGWRGGARSDQRAVGRLVVRGPRPPAGQLPARPWGAGRALAGMRGPRAPAALPPPSSWGRRRPTSAPPLPRSLCCSQEAPSRGGRAGRCAPTPGVGRSQPAAAPPGARGSAGRDLGGTSGSRVRTPRRQGLSPSASGVLAFAARAARSGEGPRVFVNYV